MAASKPTASMDISDIQRRMAQIRNEMHQEVRGAVKSAQSLTSWHGVVKNHPWLSLSIASAAGYLIVPKRHSPAPTIVAVHAPPPELLAGHGNLAPPTRRKSGQWRILGTAMSLLAPVAVRVVQNYALGRVEEWLSQHPFPSAPGGAGAGSAPEPNQTAGLGRVSRIREYG